jgi:hypothetical protein
MTRACRLRLRSRNYSNGESRKYSFRNVCRHGRSAASMKRFGETASAERPVPGIEIAFAPLTAADERQADIEDEISEEMRCDIRHKIAKFHIERGENSAQHKYRDDTA